MRLLDRIAQRPTPFMVENLPTRTVTCLSGAADYADALARCATRYVLSDDLTRLCTALAYSKGARTLECADLLHIPATELWMEWSEAPWREELALHGMARSDDAVSGSGRRGAWVRASHDGRRGLLRTFWTVGERETDVLASCMEAYFDLDTGQEEPEPLDHENGGAFAVSSQDDGDADLLRQCFRFRYEKSWANYYASAQLGALEQRAIACHALGTIAIDIPVLLAFFLLLGTRGSLPQRPLTLARLNRARARLGKPPLLDHVEVLSPLTQPYQPTTREQVGVSRRSPRLHHVRGHLVRRGSQLFWRVPHMRGTARSGIVRSRTVTWTFETGSFGDVTPH
jgi:hypothetical protein